MTLSLTNPSAVDLETELDMSLQLARWIPANNPVDLFHDHPGYCDITIEDGRYRPAGPWERNDQFALIVPVYRDNKLVDLLAIEAMSPHHWWLRRGKAIALEPLSPPWPTETQNNIPHVFLDPARWLMADGEGYVILNWADPDALSVFGSARYVSTDPDSADRLIEHLAAAGSSLQIIIKEPSVQTQ